MQSFALDAANVGFPPFVSNDAYGPYRGQPLDFNTRIVALRFFFGMTCGREEMKRYMRFRTEPRKLPAVFSYSNQIREAPSSLLMHVQIS
jgi:hypothetical protein